MSESTNPMMVALTTGPTTPHAPATWESIRDTLSPYGILFMSQSSTAQHVALLGMASLHGHLSILETLIPGTRVTSAEEEAFQTVAGVINRANQQRVNPQTSTLIERLGGAMAQF